MRGNKDYISKYYDHNPNHFRFERTYKHQLDVKRPSFAFAIFKAAGYSFLITFIVVTTFLLVAPLWR